MGHNNSLVFTILLIAVLSFLNTRLTAAGGSPDSQTPERMFTESELAEHDGSDPSKPIYISIKRVVYDVSAGKGFYGKGQEYNVLVGRDSTRAVALMSLEPDVLAMKDDLSGLHQKRLEDLDTVIRTTYKKKYPIVGRLALDGEALTQGHDDL